MFRGSLSDNLRRTGALIREKGLAGWIRQDLRIFLDRLAVQFLAGHYRRGFHRLYYYSAYNVPPQTWRSGTWFGVPIQKCPMDLLVYQEIVYATRPEVIVETGTAAGASALFFASLGDLLGGGEVITVDIVDESRVQHPRITRLLGSSTDPAILEQIRRRVQGRRTMVVLDSDHSKDHVLRELEMYSPLVSVGQYLIVEDSNIHGHPVQGYQSGAGPTEAIVEFLRGRQDFQVDRDCEKHLLSFNPGGYLRRVKL